MKFEISFCTETRIFEKQASRESGQNGEIRMVSRRRFHPKTKRPKTKRKSRSPFIENGQKV